MGKYRQPSTNNVQQREVRLDEVTKAKHNLEDTMSMQTPYDVLSNLPLVGKFFEPLKQMASRESAIAETEWEMAYNSQEAEENRQFQKSEREATQEYNYKMWQEQNEYNTLASRLQRAKEAGVNPNAILGEGDTAAQSPASSSPMSGNSASYSSSLANTMYNNSLDVAKTRAEVENISADTENKKYELDWNKRTEQARHDIFINQAYDYKASGDLKGKEAEIAQAMYDLASQKQDAELKIMFENLNNIRLQNLDIINNIRFVDGQIKYYEQQTDNLEQQEEILKKENKLKEYMIAYSHATGLPYGTDEFNTAFYMHCTGQDSKYIKTRMMIASADASAGAVVDSFGRVVDVVTNPDGTPIIPTPAGGDKNDKSKNQKKPAQKKPAQKKPAQKKSPRKLKWPRYRKASQPTIDAFKPQPQIDPNTIMYYDGPMGLTNGVVPFVAGPAKAIQFVPKLIKVFAK